MSVPVLDVTCQPVEAGCLLRLSNGRVAFVRSIAAEPVLVVDAGVQVLPVELALEAGERAWLYAEHDWHVVHGECWTLGVEVSEPPV